MLVLTAMAGNTGWHNLIPFNSRYAPHLPNYSMSAGGRTFPSAAGFHVSNLFFTDDSGTYFFETKHAPQLVQPTSLKDLPIETIMSAHRDRVRQLSDRRLKLPPQDPHVEGHNQWVANCPGSLFVIPVADLAEHNIANLCYYLQNGYMLYDDIHQNDIPGLEQFHDLVDPNRVIPLSFLEQYTLLEANAELVSACYAGALMLQAMGLGGWMYNGVNPYSVLGASGDPAVPGLGFDYQVEEHWTLPNVLGLQGVFEGHCPPYYPSMHEAVLAVVDRKFGLNGPFHEKTPGPWKDSGRVRRSAQIHSERFIACISRQAQYIYDQFGKFPGTVPTMLAFMYLQAHHLDLNFYDQYYGPGAYLNTHANHMKDWHSE